MADYTLFAPKSHDRSLTGDYPELLEFDEFRNLSNKEMLFVWYFANVTSPFANVKNKRDRARFSLEKVWDKNPPATFKNEALTGQFSSKIRDAVERMASFVPSIRLRAKSMTEKMFTNYETILDVDKEDLIGEAAAKKRDEYVTLGTKIAKDLPLLVKQIESGYGIKDKRGSGDDTEENIMDRLREGE